MTKNTVPAPPRPLDWNSDKQKQYENRLLEETRIEEEKRKLFDIGCALMVIASMLTVMYCMYSVYYLRHPAVDSEIAIDRCD